MRILITGGAGYLGSVMCQTLLDAGHEVTVFDNFRHGMSSLNHLCAYKTLSIVHDDVRVDTNLDPHIYKCDVVIPLAALVGVSECLKDTTAAYDTNFIAIRELCRLTTKRIIFPNTNSGYGTSDEKICTEESPLKPISLYGITKCNAEKEILKRGNATVFRLATVFGMSPRMRWDLMVNDFVYRAVKDRCITLFEPHFRRNFIHVRDVARAFLWAIENPEKTNDQVFNLGDDRVNMNKLALAKLIGKYIPFEVSIAEHMKDIDKRDYFVQSKKLYDAGFNLQYSLDDGIIELIKGCNQY
jgi:nucleoside-diphosphate-sugar epimerase